VKKKPLVLLLLEEISYIDNFVGIVRTSYPWMFVRISTRFEKKKWCG